MAVKRLKKKREQIQSIRTRLDLSFSACRLPARRWLLFPVATGILETVTHRYQKGDER